jgi:hypothetical protein
MIIIFAAAIIAISIDIGAQTLKLIENITKIIIFMTTQIEIRNRNFNQQNFNNMRQVPSHV